MDLSVTTGKMPHMADRLAIIDWAYHVEIPTVPTPPWVTEQNWRQLFRDTRALLVFLASTCDPATGHVDYDPDSWAEMLTIDGEQIEECVGQLCAFGLAHSDSNGNEDTYAVQLPRDVRAQRTGTVPDDFPASHYATRRHSIWTPLLRAARLGTLKPQWRETLSVDNWFYRNERPPEDPQIREADEMIINELRTMPPAAWEPFVAEGDWRRALQSWHQTAIEVHDSFEILRLDARRDRDDMTGSVELADDEATPLTRNTSLRSSTDAFHARERDEIEALYLAGLAAGGDDVDWVSWYRNRIQKLDDVSFSNVPSNTEILQQLDNPDVQAAMQMLPDYWRTTQ